MVIVRLSICIRFSMGFLLSQNSPYSTLGSDYLFTLYCHKTESFNTFTLFFLQVVQFTYLVVGMESRIYQISGLMTWQQVNGLSYLSTQKRREDLLQGTHRFPLIIFVNFLNGDGGEEKCHYLTTTSHWWV